MPSSTSNREPTITNTLNQLTTFLPYALGAVALLLIFSLADRTSPKHSNPNHKHNRKRD